ncbi:hypothetical protein [Thauera aminoaromatica]|jgi:hypothetical protein|uniref:hypothetical protein n=1 Tax=Thauera aminoaromatica TaxID=164330 RepID=UPI0012F875DD|nr:hypothetical protein [Thauera aminoaromatica]
MERASQHDDPDLKARSDALRRAAGYRVDGRLDPIVRRRSVTRKVLTFLVIALVFGFAIDFANRLDPHAAAAILWLESNSSVKEQVGEIGGARIVKVRYFGAQAGRRGVDREYFFVVRGSKGHAQIVVRAERDEQGLYIYQVRE